MAQTLPGSARDRSTISVYALLTILLVRWRLIALVTLLGVVGGAASVVLLQKYMATLVFSPQDESSSLSSLSSLASQFGVAIPIPSGGESVDFYAKMLQGQDLRLAVARHTYHLPDGRAGDLFTLLDIEGSDVRSTQARMMTKLDRMVSVDADATANTVTVTVKAKSPALAEAIGSEIVAQIDTFNTSTHQSQARAERRFIQGRLQVVRGDLRGAEDSLQSFLQRNRSTDASPQLQFQEQRLTRHVTEQQQLVTGLTQAYEQARIEEVRNTPVITVVDAPAGSAEPVAHLGSRMLLGLFVGFGLGIAAAFGATFFEEDRLRNEEDYTEFRRRLGALNPMGGPRGRLAPPRGTDDVH